MNLSLKSNKNTYKRSFGVNWVEIFWRVTIMKLSRILQLRDKEEERCWK